MWRMRTKIGYRTSAIGQLGCPATTDISFRSRARVARSLAPAWLSVPFFCSRFLFDFHLELLFARRAFRISDSSASHFTSKRYFNYYFFKSHFTGELINSTVFGLKFNLQLPTGGHITRNTVRICNRVTQIRGRIRKQEVRTIIAQKYNI